MNKSIAIMLVLILTTLSTITFLPVKAEAKTITVPEDYPSIQEAVNSATDGDTIYVKAGNYSCAKNQTLTIDKAITLTGENAQNTIINIDPPLVPMAIFTYQYMGYSDAIKIRADNVKVSGLTISTSGGAISIDGDSIELRNNIINSALSITGNYVKATDNILDTQGNSVTLSGSHHTISNNTMKGVGCRASYSTITQNVITGQAVDGLIVIEGSSNTVYANKINADGWYGIVVRLNVNGTIIAQNFIEGCVGIHMEWASNSIVSANTIKNYAGIDLDRGSNNVFSENHLENNTIGLILGYDQTDISRQHGGPCASNNTVFHNNFVKNKQQAIDWNWLGTNYWDSGGEGNYWSNYNGSDWTFDGIGDSPYKLDEAKSYYAETTQGIDHYPLMVPFHVSSGLKELPDGASVTPKTTDEQTSSKPREPTTASSTEWIIIAILSIGAAAALLVYFKVKKSIRNDSLTATASTVYEK